ncbi:MAG: toll/interleukin-1 receptor domain-containing protein [bacterium]|nr:toll/interleukin-1 receptor domain-containing protein [bacterium]
MSVFISYSRRDSEFVDLLHRLLLSKGYDAWMDRRGIDAGDRWDVEIEQAIQQRSHLIVVLSPDAAASQNVADEWSYALDEGKIIIPIGYRACNVPMRLRRLQRIEFENRPFAVAFRELSEVLGAPDSRPEGPIALARREGMIFVEARFPLDLERTRVAFVYSDYPTIRIFLNVIWATLLWRGIERGTYGERWLLRDKVTGQEYTVRNDVDRDRLLLHEVGVEPGAQLEVVFLNEGERR